MQCSVSPALFRMVSSRLCVGGEGQPQPVVGIVVRRPSQWRGRVWGYPSVVGPASSQESGLCMVCSVQLPHIQETYRRHGEYWVQINLLSESESSLSISFLKEPANPPSLSSSALTQPSPSSSSSSSLYPNFFAIDFDLGSQNSFLFKTEIILKHQSDQGQILRLTFYLFLLIF